MNSDTLVEQIKLDLLRLDGGTQARVAIDDAIVAEYAHSLRIGEVLPPVVVFFDGAEYWLADGFHRYHAHQALGEVEICGVVHSGNRREAVLYSVGANNAHGLRRSNEDKRKAVRTLLEDQEWAAWSDHHIARTCGVSQPFVGSVRGLLTTVISEKASERTYTTKHGTTATMQTAKIGKRKLATAPTSPGSEEAPPAPATIEAPQIDTVPETTAPFPSSEQGPVAMSELEALLAENTALRAQVEDLKTRLANSLADNEMMGRVFDADNQVKAALAEAALHRARCENAERTLAEHTHEFNERARDILYWKERTEKAEEQLQKTA